MKNQNGITIIALIITIVVMLILTGVVVNMAFGDNNGIINKSQTAVKKTYVSESKDYILESCAYVLRKYEYIETASTDLFKGEIKQYFESYLGNYGKAVVKRLKNNKDEAILEVELELKNVSYESEDEKIFYVYLGNNKVLNKTYDNPDVTGYNEY